MMTEQEHDDLVEQCAAIVDQCNREGPYQAIGAAARIRALKIGDVVARSEQWAADRYARAQLRRARSKDVPTDDSILEASDD